MDEQRLSWASIDELAGALRARELSVVELTQALLARIRRLDPRLGAFVAVTEERAMREALRAQQELDAGRDRGPLHGIPYAAKDLYGIAGEPTEAGTRLLADNVAECDCHVIERLTEAGMVLLGRLHTVQLAGTLIGINHERGTPHNPWCEVPHIPGGSSSGSGVAVAAGLAPVALGSDTGGSVRAPASLCGIVGLKTTVGRIGRSGIYPLSETFDSMGPLTRCARDAARVYDVMQGIDSLDDSTRGRAPELTAEALERPLAGLRLGIGRGRFFDRATEEVATAVIEAAHVLERLGARVEDMELPEVAEMARLAAVSPPLIATEAYAINRRLFEQHRAELDPVVGFIALGEGVAAHAYLEAQKERRRVVRALAQRLADVDALLVPTTPDVARPVAEVDASLDTHRQFASQYARCTLPGNMLELCGVSVPCGFGRAGLPIGLLVYAKSFDERTALQVAHAFERATEHHLRSPDLTWAARGTRPA